MFKTSPEGIQNDMTTLLEWFIRNCEKFNLEKSEKWYIHNPHTFTENVNYKLIWDMNTRDNVIVETRRDIVIVNKTEKTAIIIDVAIPGDKKIIDQKKEKI